MIAVSVQVDIEKAVRFLRLLPNEANKAASSALNSTAKEAQREAVKRIAYEANLTQTEVRAHIHLHTNFGNRR